MSHNLMSQNQLADWHVSDEVLEMDEKINDYYDCLIECEDEASSCKRICKEILV
jgi:hypothetical protein